jgi:ribonuclease HI
MGRVRKPTVNPRSFGEIKHRLRNSKVRTEIHDEDYAASQQILEEFVAREIGEAAPEAARARRLSSMASKKKRTAKDDADDDEVQELTATVSTPAMNLRSRTVTQPVPITATEAVVVPQSTPPIELHDDAPAVVPVSILLPRRPSVVPDWTAVANVPKSKALKAHEKSFKPANYKIPVYAPHLRRGHQRQERVSRYRKYIGEKRLFAGAVKVDGVAAYQADIVRLQDIERIGPEHVLVYFTDGSLSQKGYMSSAVVWRDHLGWDTEGLCLGQHKGTAYDAETCAIAMALDFALNKVRLHTNVKLVRVYSDAKGVLSDLKDLSAMELGPMLFGKYALQILYDRTDSLVAKGVRVEIHWVKGHHNSNGNKEADRVAGLVSRSTQSVISRERRIAAAIRPISPRLIRQPPHGGPPDGNTDSSATLMDIGLSQLRDQGCSNEHVDARTANNDGRCGEPNFISLMSNTSHTAQATSMDTDGHKVESTNKDEFAHIIVLGGTTNIQQQMSGLQSTMNMRDIEIKAIHYQFAALQTRQKELSSKLLLAQSRQSEDQVQWESLKRIRNMQSAEVRSRDVRARIEEIPIIDLTGESD